MFRQRVATPRGDYDGTIDAVARWSPCRGSAGRASVGIGMPGVDLARDRAGQERQLDVAERPTARRDLEARLRREVRLANDANCFALSEATDGAAAGMPVVFGVILGTGVGGGVVITAASSSARTRSAGSGGTTRCRGRRLTNWPGPACYCGRSGCIETFLSGPGLARDHHAPRPGAAASPEEIVGRRRAGAIAEAAATMARYEHRLARGLASIINVLDPDVDRARRRACRTSTRLYERVPSLWERVRFLGRGRHAAGPRRCTATRAAFAARHGCGS